jgi:DNA-directed RNA polymerase subunit M/transcription elongation factor TFIIS
VAGPDWRSKLARTEKEVIDSPSRVAKREEAGPRVKGRKCPKCGEWKFLELRYDRDADLVRCKCTTCLYRWDELPLDRRQQEV